LFHNNKSTTMNFYRPLGLQDIVTKKCEIDKILRLASFEPDFKYEKKADKKGRVYFDRYKFLGKGFGVNVHGFRMMDTNEQGEEIERFEISDWGIFAKGHADTVASHALVDCDDSGMFYLFAEDLASKNTFELRVNNALELLDRYSDLRSLDHVLDYEQTLSEVDMALLMTEGTVLLPVEKSPQQQFLQSVEDQIRKELIEKSRAGDAAAELVLAQMAQHSGAILGERLGNEDLLTVLDGYFLNMEEQTGVFYVLGDIKTVDEITNAATDEKLYCMNISATETMVTVYINQKDLMGLPTAGMRLMGVGLLQGFVTF